MILWRRHLTELRRIDILIQIKALVVGILLLGVHKLVGHGFVHQLALHEGWIERVTGELIVLEGCLIVLMLRVEAWVF